MANEQVYTEDTGYPVYLRVLDMLKEQGLEDRERPPELLAHIGGLGITPETPKIISDEQFAADLEAASSSLEPLPHDSEKNGPLGLASFSEFTDFLDNEGLTKSHQAQTWRAYKDLSVHDARAQQSWKSPVYIEERLKRIDNIIASSWQGPSRMDRIHRLREQIIARQNKTEEGIPPDEYGRLVAMPFMVSRNTADAEPQILEDAHADNQTTSIDLDRLHAFLTECKGTQRGLSEKRQMFLVKYLNGTILSRS